MLLYHDPRSSIQRGRKEEGRGVEDVDVGVAVAGRIYYRQGRARVVAALRHCRPICPPQTRRTQKPLRFGIALVECATFFGRNLT